MTRKEIFDVLVKENKLEKDEETNTYFGYFITSIETENGVVGGKFNKIILTNEEVKEWIK